MSFEPRLVTVECSPQGEVDQADGGVGFWQLRRSQLEGSGGESLEAYAKSDDGSLRTDPKDVEAVVEEETYI